jgi:hypothetical protein
MRLEITIPDPIYSNAQRVATEMGVSFDHAVSDAMEIYLADEYDGPEPTPELIASLRKAQADVKAGKGPTMAQVEESLAAKRAAWLHANPGNCHRSAHRGSRPH